MVYFGISQTIELRKGQNLNPVIAEIKVHSPMYGDLLGKRAPLDILKVYEECNVAGISYITAPQFRGNIDLLKKICMVSSLPVLRKDFILSLDEIERTASVGASSVLLIARMLKSRTAEFVDHALEHGLQPMVEVHSKEEITYANDSNAKLVAINNRDISKFECDNGSVIVSENIYQNIDRGKTIISASGIYTLDALRRALDVTDAVLVGTAFMQAKDTAKTVKAFVRCTPC